MLSKSQEIACDAYLAQYPKTWHFGQIFQGIEDNSPEIVVWEPLESLPAHKIISVIDGLESTIAANFVEA